jgi:hypothetical protein
MELAVFIGWPANLAAAAWLFTGSKSKPAAGKPLLAIFRARFWPITPNPTMPILY